MFAVVWLGEKVYFQFDIWNTNCKVLVVVERQHTETMFSLYLFFFSAVIFFSFANKFIQKFSFKPFNY